MRMLVAVALVLVLAGCSRVPQSCQQLGGFERSKCLSHEAELASDAMLCLRVHEVPLQTSCVNTVALAHKDPTLCDAIVDPKSREFCKQDIYLAKNDTVACASLIHPPARDGCLDGVARQMSDWRPCISISGGDYRDRCIDDLSRRTGDVHGCLALDPGMGYRDGCLFTVSIKERNTTGCEEIANAESGDFCHINIAVAMKDGRLCEPVSATARHLCQQLVADAQEGVPVLNATS